MLAVANSPASTGSCRLFGARAASACARAGARARAPNRHGLRRHWPAPRRACRVRHRRNKVRRVLVLGSSCALTNFATQTSLNANRQALRSSQIVVGTPGMNNIKSLLMLVIALFRSRDATRVRKFRKIYSRNSQYKCSHVSFS